MSDEMEVTEESKKAIGYDKIRAELARKALEQEAGTNSMFSRVGDNGFAFAVLFLSVAVLVCVGIICGTAVSLVEMVIEYAKADFGGL